MHHNIKLLRIFYFFWGFNMFAPVAIIYFQHITHSYMLALSLFTITLFSTSLFDIPTSVISDLMGRKIPMLLGTAITMISFIVLMFAHTYVFLILSAICNGLGQALFSSNTEALLYDSLKEHNTVEEYAMHYGKGNSFFQIGLALSGLLGGLLASISLPLVIKLSIFPPIFWFVSTLFLKEPTIHSRSDNDNTGLFFHLKKTLVAFKNNPKLCMFSIAAIGDKGIGETIFQFTPVFISQVWPIWGIGVARFLSGILGTLGFWVSGKVITTLNMTKSLMGAKMYNRIVNTIAYAFPTPVSPALMVSTDFTYMIGLTAESDTFQKQFTDKQRSTMASITSFAGSIFFGIFAFLFGFIADKLPTNIALLLGEICAFFFVFIYWKALRMK